MHKWLIPILLSHLVILSAFSQYSLEECQNLALQNLEKLSIADLRALIEQDRVSELRTYTRPRLTGEVDLIYGGETKGWHKHRAQTHSKLSLEQSLYDARSTKAISAQKKLYEASAFDIEGVELEIIQSVNEVYFRFLAAQKREIIIRESIDALQEQLRITKNFYREGLVHASEFVVVEVELAQLNQDLMTAHNQFLQIRARLNRLIGLDLDAHTTVFEVVEAWDLEEDMVNLVAQAKCNHPSLLSLKAQLEAAQYKYESEKGEFYPSFYAFANYSSSSDFALPYEHGVDVGVGMKMAFYEGGKTLVKLRRLKKETCELEYRYKELENEIELAIRSAYLDIKSAVGKIPVALKGIKLAEENFRMIKDQFDEGLITNVDVIKNENMLLQARLNYYQALYDFYQAKAKLAYATGTQVNGRICP